MLQLVHRREKNATEIILLSLYLGDLCSLVGGVKDRFAVCRF